MARLGPSRTHYDLITPQTYRVVECSLANLNRLRVPYVLVGGWAIAAFGSAVPSVDTDVYLHRSDRAGVVGAIEKACGFAVNRSDTLELLDWDDWTTVLSLDVDLGGAELRFDPRQVFLDHPPETRHLRLPDRPPVAAFVPPIDCLLFLKLCAWRGRRYYWEANRDPRLLARMDPIDRNASRGKTLLHWERKAGKDLYDAAQLVHFGASIESALAIAESYGLREALAETLIDPPALLQAYAEDLHPDVAARHVVAMNIRNLSQGTD